MKHCFHAIAVLLSIAIVIAACTPSAPPLPTFTTAPSFLSPSPSTASPTAQITAPLNPAETDLATGGGSPLCCCDAPDGSATQEVTEWSRYNSAKYSFSIDFPAGWKMLEVPNEKYQTNVDQVWFVCSSFPPPQTGARPDIAITITPDDPSPGWQPQFFDNYQTEAVQIGEVEAVRISGTNREMGSSEVVVIIPLRSGVYLQIAPNGSAESLRVFDSMVTSLKP